MLVTVFVGGMKCLSLKLASMTAFDRKLQQRLRVGKAYTSIFRKMELSEPLRAAGGSSDPNINLALSVAMRRAKANGVPKDNISATLTRVCGYGILMQLNRISIFPLARQQIPRRKEPLNLLYMKPWVQHRRP